MKDEQTQSSVLARFAAKPCEFSFRLAAFLVPLSLTLGRTFVLISFLAVVIQAARRRIKIHLPVSTVFGFALLLTLVVATFTGIRPEGGVGRLTKLLWYIAIPTAASVVADRATLLTALRWFGAGSVARAVYVLLRNPVLAWNKTVSEPNVTFSQAMIDVGTITDGQRMMLGLIVAILLWLYVSRSGSRRETTLWACGSVALAAALLMTLKRGSMLVTMAMLAFVFLRHWRWQFTVAAAFCALVVLASIPAVRTRVADLSRELDSDSGGRMHLWTYVTPRLVAENPFGIGFLALTGADMRKTSPLLMHLHRHRKWKDLNHLHSNPLQNLVDAGWLGLVFYLLWMGAALREGVAVARLSAGRPGGSTLGMAPLLLLIAILLNGLVEYNFANAVLVLSLGLVLGMGGRLAYELKRCPNGDGWEGFSPEEPDDTEP